MTPEEILNLSDDGLYKLLQKRSLKCGPVTPNTRSLYEKRLIKHFKESKVPNLTPQKSPHQIVFSQAPSSTPEYAKSTQTDQQSTEPAKQTAYKHVEPLPVIPDISIIPAHGKSTQTHVEPEVKKIYPPLEFKLLNSTLKNDQIQTGYDKDDVILLDSKKSAYYSTSSSPRLDINRNFTDVNYSFQKKSPIQNSYTNSATLQQRFVKHDSPSMFAHSSVKQAYPIYDSFRNSREELYQSQGSIYYAAPPPQPRVVQSQSAAGLVEAISTHKSYILCVVLVIALYFLYLINAADTPNPIS